MPEPTLHSRPLLQRIPTHIRVLLVFATLYLFLLGIGGMGAAFKTMGKGYTQELLGSDAGPLVALFIGILATTLVQSSSTTTSMIVALVAAGQLEYEQAIYMVMGANVGTTVTNSLVSLGHMRQTAEYKRAFAAATVHDFFNLIVLLILFPLEVMTGLLDKMAHACADGFAGVGGTKLASPIKEITKPVLKAAQSGLESLGDGGGWLLALSVLLTFAALVVLVKILKSIMLSKLENLFDRVIFKSPLRGLVFGFALTVLVQSSSITTSVAVPLVGAGVLTIHQVMPYTMGANIGTTVTALLASLAAMAGATPDTMAAASLGLVLAFHHVLFNVMGVAIVWWIRGIPIRIAETFATISMRNKLIPLVYIICTFYLIPLAIIIISRNL